MRAHAVRARDTYKKEFSQQNRLNITLFDAPLFLRAHPILPAFLEGGG